MTIFSGNLDTGFVLGDWSAAVNKDGGWDIFEADKMDRIGWFATVVEALRYLGARDTAMRNVRISQDLVRWGITERKRSQANG